MTDFEGLLSALAGAGVEFILVGGLAARAHGSARSTQDIDVVYSRSQPNLQRLQRALSSHSPYPRDAPPGLPFRLDSTTLHAGLNFTLTTSLGAIDLLGEIPGGGAYEDLRPFAVPLDLFGVRCACLDLDKLIETKRAAGRPRDFDAIAELEALREERRRG